MASKNPSMQGVIEVLDTANDSKEIRSSIAEDSSSSSDSRSRDDSHGISKGIRKQGSKLSAQAIGPGEDDGSRGPIDQLKDYRDHSDELHRRHRGLMQWKVSLSKPSLTHCLCSCSPLIYCFALSSPHVLY